MQPGKVANVTKISLSEIKKMGAASGPCISILAAEQAELKSQLKTAEQLLGESGADKAAVRHLMETARELSDGIDWTAGGLAVYCSPGFAKTFQVPQSVGSSVTVGGHFYIKPLIPLADSDRTFYLLALSQKHSRLLRCTDHSSEEVPLPESVPASLWQDVGSDRPDHVQDNRSSAGPDVGGMKGVAFSTNTDNERRDEYLAHYYKHLSEGVTTLLKVEGAPLVIAGVEYEIALFKRVNVYPALVQEAVQGAPDGLKGGELHRRAIEAVRGHFDEPLKAALARYDELGVERVSSTVREIVKAAFDGRVLDLILAEDAQYMGSFDETNRTVTGHKQPEPGDEDLLNLAALQTILHAGQVFVVPATQIPHGAPAAAVFRY